MSYNTKMWSGALPTPGSPHQYLKQKQTHIYIYIYIIYIHVIDVIWDTHIRKLLYAILSNPGLKAIKLHSEWPIRPMQLGIMMANWAIA